MRALELSCTKGAILPLRGQVGSDAMRNSVRIVWRRTGQTGPAKSETKSGRALFCLVTPGRTAFQSLDGLGKLDAARIRQSLLHREGWARAAHPQEARARRWENQRPRWQA